MWDIGVRGKLWGVLKSLYKKTSAKIRIGDEFTEEFERKLGVQQGAVLSPMLYSIYLNDLAEKLREKCKGIYIGGRKVVLLLYADDIIIMT